MKIFSLILILILFVLPGLSFAGELSVKGNRFFIDGKPFDMIGLRVASASQSDSLTNLLINQLDDYKASGLNTISVFVQGSSGGYSDPFSPDGKSLDKLHTDRLVRIIKECDSRSMVVIVGIFYQRVFGNNFQKHRSLNDVDAIKNATKTLTEILKPYGNVIINIANEQNSNGYKDFLAFDFRNPQNIIELCRLVKRVDPNRIVGGGGYHDGSNIIIGKSQYADVLLFDTWDEDVDKGHTSGWHYDYFRQQGVPDKPMVNVEIFGAWTRIASPPGVYSEEVKKIHLAEIDEAKKRPGLSVHLHSNLWCQGPADGYPVRFDLGGDGTPENPGIRWWFEYAKSAKQ
jgi:hypothetical protein